MDFLGYYETIKDFKINLTDARYIPKRSQVIKNKIKRKTRRRNNGRR